MDDILQNFCYESLSGYERNDWFLDQVIKLERKLAFYFENTKKDTIMTEKDEGFYGNKKKESEKEVSVDKVRGHCHLTSKNRDPAHQKPNINVTQRQSNFAAFVYHIFRFPVLMIVTFSPKIRFIKRRIK